MCRPLVGLALGAVAACSPPTQILVEPLYVVHVSPNGGATCVDLDTDVAVVFSHPLDAATLTDDAIQLRFEEDAVASSIDYDDAIQTVRLRPDQALAWDAAYTLVIDEAVASPSQGHLPAPVESSFTTAPAHGCDPTATAGEEGGDDPSPGNGGGPGGGHPEHECKGGKKQHCDDHEHGPHHDHGDDD